MIKKYKKYCTVGTPTKSSVYVFCSRSELRMPAIIILFILSLKMLVHINIINLIIKIPTFISTFMSFSQRKVGNISVISMARICSHTKISLSTGVCNKTNGNIYDLSLLAYITQLILAILLKPFDFLVPKTFQDILHANCLTFELSW